MKSDLYQIELNSLRDSARDFSKRYPAIAPHLSGASTDPDVERILQGTAFLSAGIRERLDTEFPDFAQSILRTIAPDYLKDIPASTIVEFKPRSILNNVTRINAGSRLDSDTNPEMNCRFSTCKSVEIHPIDILSCEVSGNDRQTTIDIFIRNISVANTPLNFTELQFYIGSDYLSASNIYYNLCKNLTGLKISSGGREVTLDRDSLKPNGWQSDFSLFDSGNTSFNSFRRVQEYFINKNKFLFFKITDLNEFFPIPNAFKISITLAANSYNIKADKDTFKLFCTPAVNIFDTDAEPINLDQRSPEVRLKPVRGSGRNITIHAIDSLHGQARINSEKIQYQSFSLANKLAGRNPVYELIQHSNGTSDQENILRINYPGGFSNISREILTAKLKCTNGFETRNLKSGDIKISTHDIPDTISFKNISAVSDYVQPITDGRILWNLITHLSVNYLPVISHSNLVSLLNLYNPTAQSDTRDHAANKRRIESIKSVDSSPEERIFKGYLVRGRHIEVALDGTGFPGIGDIFLFGELLFYIFSQFSELNSFIRMTIINTANGEKMEWLSNSVKN